MVLALLAVAVALISLPAIGLAWRESHEDDMLSEARRKRAAIRRQWNSVRTRDDELFLGKSSEEE